MKNLLMIGLFVIFLNGCNSNSISETDRGNKESNIQVSNKEQQEGHAAEPGDTGQTKSIWLPGKTLYGLTPFPYDVTPASSTKTHQLVARNGHLYALHYDDGVPWREAFADKPWPDELQKNWTLWKNRIPKSQKIYLGLAPLALNRKTLAHASKTSALPPGWDKLDLDNPQVMKAFLNYAKRAVEHFEPDFLNIGIEAGNLAFNDPERWNKFETFYKYVRTELKKQWPQLPVGISFTLQYLMREGVGERVRDLVESSDYLGLSFYPYGSSENDRQTGQALPPPPQQWRMPFQWVRNYTNKPIAICETGYTTESFNIEAFGLELVGDTSFQEQYLQDLSEIAKKEGYFFVVWFLMVDYDRLYEKIDDPQGIFKLWRNIGLWDNQLKPKPAWTVWQKLVADQPD